MSNTLSQVSAQNVVARSVQDPSHFHTDLDPALDVDAYPDPALHLGADPAIHVGADPDPDLHVGADPDRPVKYLNYKLNFCFSKKYNFRCTNK